MSEPKPLNSAGDLDAIWSNTFQFELGDVARIAFGEVRLGETRFHTAAALTRADAIELGILLLKHAGAAPAEPMAAG